MAIHKVQAPNGSILEIEGPDDATDEELINVASQHYANKPSKNSGPISTIASGVDAVKDMDALTYGAGAAALAAGIPLAKKLKDKFFGSTEAPPRIEPQMDVSTGGPREPFLEPDKPPPPPPSGTPKSWEETLSPQDRELLERSKANAAAKAQTAPATAPIPEPPAFIRNQPPAPVVQAPANPKIPALLQAPAGADIPPANTPKKVWEPPTASLAVSAPALPPSAPTNEPPTLAPAATPAEAPLKKEPKATKAAVTPVAETEKLTKEQKGMKNHLVGMYGGGAEGEAAYNKVKQILGYTPEYPVGQGGSLTSEQHQVIKDWRKANIEGPKVNLSHDMKKALKSGTAISVLMAIPGFAAAAQEKDFGKMTDIATDLLVLPFAQSREVGEGEQYELAKRRYESMVGGGRGIAPPSAYQR